MWRKPANYLIREALKRRYPQLMQRAENPWPWQERIFRDLVRQGTPTLFGQDYRLGEIRDPDTFRERVPVRSYEALYPQIDRMMRGQEDELWPGRPLGFSKSSGTTNARSKFIPVSRAALFGNHYAGGKDLMACYFHHRPHSRAYEGNSIALGGSLFQSHLDVGGQYGDVSALLMNHLPWWIRHFRSPSLDIALMDEWEAKIEKIAQQTIPQRITSLSGVPTWMVVLLRKVLEKTGKTNILEVWPHLELFMHGAVAMGPFFPLFRELIPSEQMVYQESYNASEGYFAIQDDLSRPGEMLLLTHHGIFYEFLPLEQLGQDHPQTKLLPEVELGRSYAMVISTNAGLWRYLIGDTVKFTSRSPYRIKITGRTKHFLNVFGEELVVENAETAIAEASNATSAAVSDFTAGPVFMGEGQAGAHEWVVEFDRAPEDFEQFCQVLDQSLRRLNSDYDAKRYRDMALQFPKVHRVPQGTFYEWMRRRGKLGGQNKVPRLSNERDYLQELLGLVSAQ